MKGVPIPDTWIASTILTSLRIGSFLWSGIFHLRSACFADMSSTNKGSLCQARNCLQTPHPSVRSWLGSRGPLRMKTSKQILIQLGKDAIVLPIPKVRRLLGTLSQFPWGSLRHWLGSEAHWYAHAHITTGSDVPETGKPGDHLLPLPFHSVVVFLGFCTGFKVLFFLCWF